MMKSENPESGITTETKSIEEQGNSDTRGIYHQLQDDGCTVHTMNSEGINIPPKKINDLITNDGFSVVEKNGYNTLTKNNLSKMIEDIFFSNPKDTEKLLKELNDLPPYQSNEECNLNSKIQDGFCYMVDRNEALDRYRWYKGNN